MSDLNANPEHAIRCPRCKAPARRKCTTPMGRALSVPSHDARKDAWAADQPSDQPRAHPGAA